MTGPEDDPIRADARTLAEARERMRAKVVPADASAVSVPGTAAFVASRVVAWFAERPKGFWVYEEFMDRARAEFINPLVWFHAAELVAIGFRIERREIYPTCWVDCFTVDVSKLS